MRKLGVLLSFLALTYIGVVASGCEESEWNEPMVSYYGDDKSHNWGMNCMDCHRRGGPGESWFTISGSVSKLGTNEPYPNVTIELWKEVGVGQPVAIIEVDALGNFYTTEPINWGNGLYPAVVNKNGDRIFMQYKTMIGTCNSCHFNGEGVSAPPIWAK